MDVVEKIRAGQGGFLLFGVTPPKAASGPGDLVRITERTLSRLRDADADGVALYDIAEESDRNGGERPFPFLPTLDPGEYLSQHLTDWQRPTAIYRAVGKYTEPELTEWMREQDPERVLTVLVGASSSRSIGATSLRRAYELRRQVSPDLLAGAVMIPERHTERGDEHRRMVEKQAAGASFFVSQVLYDATAAKNVVADYADECEARGIEPKPVIFTLSVCGSMKTLDFLAWLGVQVPHWLQRDLRRAENPLAASREHARTVAADVGAYCRRVGVPVAVNVESVSSRRVEIQAAVELAQDLRSGV